jgi:cell division protein FtsN
MHVEVEHVNFSVQNQLQMKSKAIIWACLFLFSLPVFSQDINYRLEVEVLIADDNSELFIPLQNYSYSLAPQAARAPIQLPSSAGRIRLQMYLLSGMNKIDIHDLLINGVKSSDRESFIIESPLAWIQRGEPLTVVLADKPYSYYKLNIPLQWSNVQTGANLQARSPIPQSFSNYSAPVTSSFPGSTVPAGYAVQIEARKDVPELTNFSDLQSFGTVYYREDPSWYRVRVGVFPTREEAMEKQNAIRKLRGGAYSRALAMQEEGGPVVLLPNRTAAAVPATSAIPQGYANAGVSRIETTAVPQNYDLTARGGIATTPQTAPPAQPQSYEVTSSRPSTLAERAPRFPDWYYNSSTTAANASASTASEPRSYDVITNNPLPKAYGGAEIPASYEAAGNLTPKGVMPAGYYVQAGAFGNYDNAQRFYQNLLDKGITNAQIIEERKTNGTILYKTWIGPYQTSATAENQKALMAKNLKISGTVISGASN